MVSEAARLKKLSSGKSLLIVEDDPLMQESLQRLLSHFFDSIQSASDPDEALERYHASRGGPSPLLVITDVNLGRSSGLELTGRLKKIDPLQRVIAISGAEESTMFIESIRCGIDRFVLKPINQDELFTALIDMLEQIDYDNALAESRMLLEESREYALRLLNDQDQFLKNAIHEIHTPLAVIITNIDLLRMEGIENESLSAIEAGARIIQNSYEDMTYLMKRDRIPDQKVVIDLVSYIAERKQYFTCIAEVNELTLSMRTGQPNLPSIMFSELKLARLVDNTLSNAIKYSYRPGEIAITVGMRNDDIYFEIRNHGPLIHDKKKIFERFHRESETKGGYGLGLSIVAQICREEEVEIEISSTPVRGTSFRYLFKNATLMQRSSPTIPSEQHKGL